MRETPCVRLAAGYHCPPNCDGAVTGARAHRLGASGHSQLLLAAAPAACIGGAVSSPVRRPAELPYLAEQAEQPLLARANLRLGPFGDAAQLLGQVWKWRTAGGKEDRELSRILLVACRRIQGTRHQHEIAERCRARPAHLDRRTAPASGCCGQDLRQDMLDREIVVTAGGAPPASSLSRAGRVCTSTGCAGAGRADCSGCCAARRWRTDVVSGTSSVPFSIAVRTCCVRDCRLSAPRPSMRIPYACRSMRRRNARSRLESVPWRVHHSSVGATHPAPLPRQVQVRFSRPYGAAVIPRNNARMHCRTGAGWCRRTRGLRLLHRR